MMPDGAQRGPRRAARDPGRDRPRDDGRRPTWPSCWRAPRTAGRPRSVAARQPARDAPRLDARDRAAVRSGRGAHARRRRPARWCGARRSPNADFKALLPTLTEVADHHHAGRRGQGRGARPVALRRAARRVRAGRPLRARSTRCSASSRPSCRRCCEQVMERQASAAGAAAARRPVPGRGAAHSSGVELMARARLRLPSRPARRLGASLHRRHAPTTCASPRATTRPISPAP